MGWVNQRIREEPLIVLDIFHLKCKKHLAVSIREKLLHFHKSTW